jgi:SAM-dependent methyltransferase
VSFTGATRRSPAKPRSASGCTFNSMSGPSAPGMNSGRWRDVDADDPAFFVGYLDRAAAGLREARLEAVRALDVAPGSSVLDVGSGAGEFLIELSRTVRDVRCVGVDASEALVAIARERAAAAGVMVDFGRGNAERLDFADGSFDRVNCSRVLLHLERPRAAVEEMARVLSPGGLVSIGEPDFDALMIDSDDLRLATAVRSALTAGLHNPDIARRLRRLVLDAELDLVDILGRAAPVPSPEVAFGQFHLLEHLDTAVLSGLVGAEDAEDWRRWIEAAATSDRFMVVPVAFRVLARKPTSGNHGAPTA